jgi:hypothetical protein
MRRSILRGFCKVPVLTSDNDVAGEYASRAASRRAEQAVHQRRSHHFGVARLVSFAAAAVVTIAALRATSGSSARMAESLGAAGLWLAFVVLVVVGSRVAARARRAGALAALNDQGLHRVRREWGDLPEFAWPAAPATHPFASDLDLFGPASLSRLFPPLSAAPGRSTLTRWLLGEPAGDVAERQRAVSDLAPRMDLRDELALLASSSRGGDAALDRLRAALVPGTVVVPGTVSVPGTVTVPGTERSVELRGLVILLPHITIGLVVAQFRGDLSGAWWLLPMAAGLLLTRRHNAVLRESLDALTEQAAAIRHFGSMATLLQKERFDSPWLKRSSEILRERDAAAALRRLHGIADWAESRHSPLLHAVLHAVTLWDFHLLARLERWRSTYGAPLGTWLDLIGDIEALSALATLAHDNPDWCFPTYDGGASPAELRASALGHPLIARGTRVCNDVTVGPPGTLLLVTGSNMAGKSTLLRAIGLNVVLAHAGGPVCARSLECPPVRLYTSIRVQDSLEHGVSYFMAELQRLKLIVDAAAPDNSPAPVLYLLDEMLHGTNSVERAVAARRVLARLLDAGAIGAVTTHDLALADGPPLSSAARQVHFTEQFTREDGRPLMSFDYALRPGPASSTNALKLLELVGLDD